MIEKIVNPIRLRAIFETAVPVFDRFTTTGTLKNKTAMKATAITSTTYTTDNTCPLSLGDNQGTALLGWDEDQQLIMDLTPRT
jgi:hypothetical protein